MSRLSAFDLNSWIDRNAEHLKPPVGNKHLIDENTDMVIMIIGGGNQRTDYHDDPVEEFFYQLRGDMMLKVNDRGQFYDVPIREGEVFYLPPHVHHSPQRPNKDSVGLVVEGNREPGDKDAFDWFCFECGTSVHRVELLLGDIVADLPPLFNSFYEDEQARTCPNCQAMHPGKNVPAGWVNLNSVN